MEIPASLGLTPQPRPDGKLNLVGKDDTGKDYVARVTAGPEVTTNDLDVLAANDRERTTSREFVQGLMERQAASEQARIAAMDAEYLEAGEHVEFAGTHKAERTVGYSRAYAANFDKVFGSN